MVFEVEKLLQSWVEAGLVNTETATAIRAYQASKPSPVVRWPALLAMAFGGAMLASGILLFVSSNWDTLSPQVRFSLVVSMVGSLHTAAAFARRYSNPLTVTLHAAGTASLGAGIALCGQIFHMSSHWSNATGLWALGAGLAYWLLREWPQFAFVAVLAPMFIASKMENLMNSTMQSFTAPMWAFGAIVAAAYVAFPSRHTTPLDHRAARWLGAFALIPFSLANIFNVSVANVFVAYRDFLDPHRLLFVAVALLIALLYAGAIRWELFAIAAWAVLSYGSSFNSLYPYIHLFIGGAAFAALGVRLHDKLTLNLGIIITGISIYTFFFSNVFDKLGRSLALIIAGIVLIGVGYSLDWVRRDLIGRMEEPAQ